MSKRTVIITPNGTETEQWPTALPSLKEMQEVVGGSIEMVRVLRGDLEGFQFTYMITNETGLIDGLPRNQKATDLYLANLRRQFPAAENPYKAAQDAMLKQYDARGVKVRHVVSLRITKTIPTSPVP